MFPKYSVGEFCDHAEPNCFPNGYLLKDLGHIWLCYKDLGHLKLSAHLPIFRRCRIALIVMTLTYSLTLLLSTVKQGDNALGSVRTAICPFVCLISSVDFRGSALPSAARSNKGHYQSTVFVSL